jgi:hypothetical protein
MAALHAIDVGKCSCQYFDYDGFVARVRMDFYHKTPHVLKNVLSRE